MDMNRSPRRPDESLEDDADVQTGFNGHLRRPIDDPFGDTSDDPSLRGYNRKDDEEDEEMRRDSDFF